jgi:class 3 adenylate cyclase
MSRREFIALMGASVTWPELIQAVGGLKPSAPLQTRVVIATGLVVVGDLIGLGAAQEQTVVGETPNLAARLQGIAEPNVVVIAESTRKLLGNLFDLQDLSAQDLKRRTSASHRGLNPAAQLSPARERGCCPPRT